MPKSALRDRARQLRDDQTLSEKRLWARLRARRLGGWKWKRQVPRGRYIVDFICAEAKLIVELDGGQHDERRAYDADRTAWLGTQGYRVIRFWNSAIVENIDGVTDAILAACGGEAPHPASPRERGEGRD